MWRTSRPCIGIWWRGRSNETAEASAAWLGGGGESRRKGSKGYMVMGLEMSSREHQILHEVSSYVWYDIHDGRDSHFNEWGRLSPLRAAPQF